MSAYCEARGSRPRITFGTLAQHIVSLDSGIEWVALEEPGREPRWAWRDSTSGNLCAGSATANAQVADPLLFMLAEGWSGLHEEEINANPHPLQFIVLAYAEIVQIIARLRPSAHVTVAVSPGVDPYALGTKLISLLEHCAQPAILS